MSTQVRKRSIVVDGRAFSSLESAARAFGISRNTLDYRLSKGWTPEEACGLAPRPSHSASTTGIAVNVQGREFKTIKDAARFFGRSYTHVFSKLKDGCTIEHALGLLKRTDSVQSEYPELAKQWHPTRNDPLTAGDVTPHSGQKVWWLCSNLHEWQAVINSRTRGHGCPYCAGQRPTAGRNLATEYPALLGEWDWERNGRHRPEGFSPRSASKVWWKCRKGHSWQATVLNRTRDTPNSCPVCLNRLLGEDNSLAKVRPEIANEWHPSKNLPLTPNDVVAGGSRKVWWICKHGHEWQAPVGRRVISGSGCPKCSLQTSRIEIAVYAELTALFENVAWRERIAGFECDIYLRDFRIGVEVDGSYWHRHRPEQELAKSAAFAANGVQLFRLREDGLPLLGERDISYRSSEDEFQVVSRLVTRLVAHAQIPNRQIEKLRAYLGRQELINEVLYREMVANLPAPPPGHSLADRHPEIAAQWAFDLNAPLSPEHFRPQANKKIWWRCESGHVRRTTPNIRVSQGTGCPQCPREPRPASAEWNLSVAAPGLASEWHPQRNGELQPSEVWPNSNRKVWWHCAEGHEWQATVASRAGGTGCPYCYGRFATKENNLAIAHPELMEEWDSDRNSRLDPSTLTPYVSKKAWWRCKQGHSWEATIYNRSKNRSGCPTCARAASRKYSIEDIQVLAKQKGGTCLSDAFTSSRLKLKFRCKEGHVWDARADALLYSGKWCPVCGRGAPR